VIGIQIIASHVRHRVNMLPCTCVAGDPWALCGNTLRSTMYWRGIWARGHNCPKYSLVGKSSWSHADNCDFVPRTFGSCCYLSIMARAPST